jgi:hypothetical protein
MLLKPTKVRGVGVESFDPESYPRRRMPPAIKIPVVTVFILSRTFQIALASLFLTGYNNYVHLSLNIS